MTPSQAIEALLARGMTEKDIAAATHSRQSVINRIKRGEIKQAKYDLGVRLVSLASAEQRPESIDHSS